MLKVLSTKGKKGEKKLLLCVVMNVLTKLVIILQGMHISNLYMVYT